MASTIARLAVSLNANSSGFSKGMRDARKDVLGVQSAVSSAKRAIMGLAGAYATMSTVKSALNAWGEQEKATAELATSLGMIGKASPEAIQGIEKFSSSVQSVTIYGDEAVTSLAALGARLGKWSGKELETATTSAIGLSKVLNIDMAAGMKLLIRAGTGSTATLAKYGLKLSDTMTEQQKFNAVLEFGLKGFKLAEAEANTYTGQMAQMKNAVGDVGEVVGSILAPSIIKVANIITQNAAPAAEYFAFVIRNWKLVILDAGARVFDVILAVGDGIGDLTGLWKDGSGMMATLFTNMAESVRVTWYLLMADLNATLDEVVSRAATVANGLAKAKNGKTLLDSYMNITASLVGAVGGASTGKSERTKQYEKMAAESSAKLFPGGELSKAANDFVKVAALNPFRDALQAAINEQWKPFVPNPVGGPGAMPQFNGAGAAALAGGAAYTPAGNAPLISNYLSRSPGAAGLDQQILASNKRQEQIAREGNGLLRQIVDREVDEVDF